MIDKECLDCRHHKNGGCDTWCENGEMWTPTKEYIEREELLQRAKQHQGSVFGAPVIIAEIEKMPEANVKEVFYAMWVRKENHMTYWYECSHCGNKPLRNEWKEEVYSSYCPHCGATMLEDWE